MQTEARGYQKYFTVSLVFHVAVLLVLILSFDFAAPLPVLENTNQHDVISAVVLGDTAKSKIVPKPVSPPPPPVQEIKKPEPAPKPQAVQQVQADKDAIALKLAQKKLAEKKALDEKKILEQKKLEQQKKAREMFANDLLSDLKKHDEKQKKVKQKTLQTQFEKTLRDQAEKSLRQQLLNEEIKLQGTQSRQSQGEVNKYKALIIQAISEHWIIPPTANKRLYCELMIHLAPGGVVLDVRVTKSSGDPALDSSARSAVMKASPLPVPTEPGAFDAFRQFALKVKPENIMASDGGMGAV